jgi:hypothetical protein
MSDPDRVRSVLGGAGFGAPRFESLHEPMYFGADPDDAYQFIMGLAGWMMDGLDEDDRAHALEDLRTTVRAHESDEGVMYDSAAWLITAHRP